jgi:histidine triad (HIT) family protein
MSSTLFSQIINSEIPGTFVYRDDLCVAFMTINPITTGHLLLVPISEFDEWTDLPELLITHMFVVAKNIGNAQKSVFDCERVALIIAGYEIPHCHLHLIPTNSMADLSFENAKVKNDRSELEESASLIINELRRMNIAGAL